ncbi:hypothetical protein J4E85_009945 [Alternaria conjuncta]|uniref:uncharacterized protein n=1 Tax=Alternaria conjuncta TaxID=181017 RepID=UPI00221E9939|nr:uncharacterized protein J4E85_009945 [Alternaria conjuncta]KAI4917426.1 hypothetical protein J4E85_009945 [Alternaria conjuncta]
MDPFRNNAAAVSNAKASTLHNHPSSTPFNTLPTHSSAYQSYQDDNPAPPAYHTVVDPTLPIPNMTNPYDPQEEDCDAQETPDDTPEITINAATQIRGHGNIVSIAQMDSVRIANLIATVLSGETIETGKMGEEEDAAGRPITPESPTTQATARGEYGAEESGGVAGSATDAATECCCGGGGGDDGRTITEDVVATVTTKKYLAERSFVPDEACDAADES